MNYSSIWRASVVAAIVGSAAACSSGHAALTIAHETPSDASVPSTGDAMLSGDGAATVTPFVPETPFVYVAKVKNILVGLAPTDEEIKAVQADPSQLKTLIDGWIALPQYQSKMLTFFQLAFQQTQVSLTDFTDQTFPRPPTLNGSTRGVLLQNLRESFARTVLQIVSAGRPLTDALTTRSFMMTPALMEVYAFLDAWQVDNAGKIVDRFKLANPKLAIFAEASQGPIPLSQTLDPTSPNYMHWYDPDVAQDSVMGPGCAQDPLTYPAAGDTLHYLIWGSLLGYRLPSGGACLQYSGSSTAPQLSAADFASWKLVAIRPPNPGESPTPFYDLATLRSSSELVLSIPRVGFFTPAFFANWQTNTSNQMRVTMNQALIVATGAAVDGTDPTSPSSTPGLEAPHASPPACFACHRTLDPTRSILASTYSWNYHTQTDPTFAQQKGLFVFQGVEKPTATLADLASTLAAHPLFASAWVQKLCYYANSTACDASDPEFQRIVGSFQSAQFSWNALVRELLSSPLTTNVTAGASARGEVVAVARRDHLCAALNFRLGLTDVCGLDVLSRVTSRTTVPEVVSGLPSDGYGRGAIAPVLPNDPTLFFRAGTENICAAVAALVVDNPSSATRWSSQSPDAAIADFVHTVMALAPSDPRAAQAQALLAAHYAAARKKGAASDALKSTFVVACLSPSSVSIGL